jgi:hypothetical protein
MGKDTPEKRPLERGEGKRFMSDLKPCVVTHPYTRRVAASRPRESYAVKAFLL